MNELLHIIESKEFPVLTSFFLGLLIAISPCTIATNITTLSFLTGKEKSKKKNFTIGLLYILGRIIAYTLLGIILFFFARMFHIGETLQYFFGKIIGPIFILIGIFLLDIIHLHGLADRCLNVIRLKNVRKNGWSALSVGIILAFAFCPYCALIYFGMFVPLSLSVSYGALLPLLFAIGAAIPVVPMAWVIVFSFDKLSSTFSKLHKFESWVRKILGVLFILSGILFIIEYYLG